MTNQWTDIAHSTLLLIFSNPAENHPGSSVWVMRALDNGAKAYVIDPRRTRMAAIIENRGGKHIRIRPGTDIAFINGVLRYVIQKIEDGTIPAQNYVVKDSQQTGIFDKGDGTGGTWPSASPGVYWPWHTDAGFLLNAAKNDYFRYGVDWTHPTEPCPLDKNYTYFKSNPSEYAYALSVKLPVYTGRIDVTPGTVSGIDNPGYTVNHGGVVFIYLKNRVSPYTPSVVVDICAKVRSTDTPWWTESDFQAFCDDVVNHSWGKNAANFGSPNYRATSILYAMGTTQHTHGSQNVRAYAILQVLTGNMGVAGGGVNALRGIGNVQGSTDMGLLYNSIPAYSSVPGSNYNAYIQRLFGNSAGTGFQQNGFKNMTYAFFHSNPTNQKTDADVVNTGNLNDPTKPYGYWPGTGSSLVGGTTNTGFDHRTMFVQMNPSNPGYSNTKPRVKALISWGMNPIQSESNSAIFRNGIKGLELLVVVDMFLTETAEAEVGPNTKVYFLPAAGFAEKAGTYTNSSRVIQWKWQVAPPKGNSKTDLETLALFAYALIQQDALNVNTNQNPYGTTSKQVIWNNLFRDQYFTGVNNPFTDWSNNDYQKDIARNNSSGYVELIYKQMAQPLANGGTIWIYSRTGTGIGGWDPTNQVAVSDLVGVPNATYATPNRSQARNPNKNNVPEPAPYLYQNWGHAWLLNRRVFYNRNSSYSNLRVPGDVNDIFVGMDRVARIFVHQSNWTVPDPVTYSQTYRSYSKLAENYGATPIHEEPKETPRPDLAAIYPSLGRDSLYPYGSTSQYPLVLTTIRYVEHYQGGPMSRNVPYLNELVPEPILEINATDAANYGLINGGLAYIRTSRSKYAYDNNILVAVEDGGTEPYFHKYGWVGPFRVRIIGVKDKQRVPRGVVAIPFHWGSKGLNTGPSANLLTNEAQDPNTLMPESKSCLCAVSPIIKP
ncbi:MAG: molybdopterin oxidoreductase family protein [Actinobacteria bacterium]|nr:molybdopterin oxidoreductase family protein [Actinomycetota bacterium]